MTFLAATATTASTTASTATTAPGLPAGILVLTVAVVTFGYALSCLFWPFGACRWCHGAGKHKSPAGRSYRVCRWCDATGLRLRLGRRVFNAVRRLRNRAR